MGEGTKIAVRERPILFKGPMVRAILDGRKTQTRRLVSAEAIARAKCATDCTGPLPDKAWADPGLGAGGYLKVPCAEGAAQRVWYGTSIGDRLWVRETWGYRGGMFCSNTPKQHAYKIAYRADDATRWFTLPYDVHNPKEIGLPKQKPKRPDQTDADYYATTLTEYWRSWRPSIYMPRWASRLTLEVTGVRVERLQEIALDDCEAEGVQFPPCARSVGNFAVLWDKINGKRAPWKSNPWVWVVTFRRDAPEARARR